MKYNLLVRWVKCPETDVLYLLKNLTKKQYESFLKADGRFVNDGEEKPSWDKHKDLQKLYFHMGKYEERYDYEKANSDDWENASLELSDEEIFKYLEEIYDFGGEYRDNPDSDEEIENIIKEKKEQYNLECVISGWYL